MTWSSFVKSILSKSSYFFNNSVGTSGWFVKAQLAVETNETVAIEARTVEKK
jgi:hypothetical protein